jgi:branched-chain amino acid transport system substrate-binding protein
MYLYATEPIRIGISLGLTGKYSETSKMQKMAYRLWETEINKKGGLLGRKVVILIMDDESDPNKAKELYRSMILEKKVDLVLGPYSSAILAAIAPIVDGFGYPMLASASAADSIWKQGYKNIFGMLTPASRYSIGILNLALLYDLKKVAIVYADDEFSTEVAKGAKKWTPQLGLELVMFEEFKKGKKNLVPLAQKARDNGAELILVGGHFNESVNMRLGLKKIKWYPKAFFATVGPALQKYKETLGIDAEFTFSTSIWEPHETSNSPQAIEFTNAFVDRYQQEPSYHAAQAFAAGQILNTAVELAGSLDQDRIRNALYELDTQCIIGRYTVGKTGMQKRWYPLTIQWQNGKKKIVWPDKEIRSVAPIFK